MEKEQEAFLKERESLKEGEKRLVVEDERQSSEVALLPFDAIRDLECHSFHPLT